MRLELYAEKPLNGEYFYAELLLPAAEYELKDAMQRTRAVGRENTVKFNILDCDILPELEDVRLDTFNLDKRKPQSFTHPARYILRRIFSVTKQAVSRPRFAYVGKNKRRGWN